MRRQRAGTVAEMMHCMVLAECHVYDKEKCYVPFDFKKEEPMFKWQVRLQRRE